MMHSNSHKLDAAAFRTFMFQGKSLFTLHNTEKDTNITFRIQSPKRKRGTPENLNTFEVYMRGMNDRYMTNKPIGKIDRRQKTFTATKWMLNENTQIGVDTINWIISHWNSLETYMQESRLEVFHMGYCCKCGMPLTVPESIQNGIGPQCFKYRTGKSIEILQQEGLYKSGEEYANVVMHALEERPDLFDKIFVPDIVRRTSDWFQKMDLYSGFGLI